MAQWPRKERIKGDVELSAFLLFFSTKGRIKTKFGEGSSPNNALAGEGVKPIL